MHYLWLQQHKPKENQVRATINTLPPSCTDRDVNKVDPPEEHRQEITVDYEDMPFCCGMSVLGHAAGEDGDWEDDPPTDADAVRACLEDQESCHNENGLLLYTINDGQTVVKEGLERAGWVVMATFKNPNSGNRVTLYGKLINQPKQKKR